MPQLADVLELETPRVRTKGEALLACSECHVTYEFDQL